MTPSKLLIAQRLDEIGAEIKAVVGLMADYIRDPRWEAVAGDMARTGELAGFWAEDIRQRERAS